MAYFTTGIGAAYGKIVDGNTTIATAGTPVRLSTTSVIVPGVWVGGDTNNTGVIYVGTSTVDGVAGQQRGIAVEPAGNSIFIPVNNLNLLYVDSSANGDIATWSYVLPE